MKNVWIIGVAIVLIAVGLILGLSGYDVAKVGDYSSGFFSSGQFSAGVFSAGLFSIGIFSAGLFSIGIFSIGVFNIGLFAVGFFFLAWRKKYLRVQNHPESNPLD